MSKSKVPYEKKVEIVRDYLEGRKGYTESVKRANNSMESFRRWVYIKKKERRDSFRIARTRYIRRM